MRYFVEICTYLESNLWNAIQSEVFRIAWHSQRLCPTGRLFDAGRSETDSGSAGLSAPCLSRRTRSTENIPRSDSENEGHAKKKNIKNEADKPYAACLLLAMVRPAWATICGKD